MLRILSSKILRSARAYRVLPLVAAAAAAVTAWLSQGTVIYSGAGATRIALLPMSAVAIVISTLAGVGTFWAIRSGASAAPLWLLALIALAWIPGPLPPAFVLWTGPMALLVWFAVALCMVASSKKGTATFFASHTPEKVTVPFSRDRPALAAGVITVLLGAFSVWQVAPSVPAGDEPHYLIITQSLLKDGDLRIENNHRQRDYRAYLDGDIPPDFRVRGRNGQIYSIHAPGVSALVAPAFALGGYHGVVLFLLILSGITAALAWHLAFLVTGRTDAAWFGWASFALSATFLFHTFAVYPDGPGSLAVLTGVWALLRTEREADGRTESVTPWFLHGAALATLPWMHTRFAVLAAGLAAVIVLRVGRTPNALAKAGALAAAPVVSAFCWIGYFVKIYGTPDPAAPYGGEPGSFAFVPDGLAGLLFDQRFGLLAYAPVLFVAFGGIAVMLARRGWRRHAAELLFVVLPYLLVVTYVAMWWGGSSAPARFFMPVLPWMAIPAAAAWTMLKSGGSRTIAIGALAFTIFASASLVLVDDGRLAFNVREAHARWLEWLNGSVDLPRGLPIWWRERETPLFRGIAIWGALAAAGWVAVRRLEGAPVFAERARLATAVAVIYAIACAAALSVTWAFEGVSGRSPAPGQLQALRRLSKEPRLLAFDVSHARRLDLERVPGELRIQPAFSSIPGGAGRNDRPLFAVGGVPAGEYRLRFSMRSSDGWIMIGIGRDQFALRTQPLADSREPIIVNFPVDVRAIMVRVDEDARRNVKGMTIEPLRIVSSSQRLTPDYARRAVHYSGTIAYFMDDRSFPEPEAFWIGGAREASVVLQPDEPRGTATLHLRNGAVENTVLVQAGAWRDGHRFGPGEERQIQIPLDHARGATLLRFTTTAGFRPSEIDPASRDDRFLGVWVRVVN
jgi:hypothetical protein